MVKLSPHKISVRFVPPQFVTVTLTGLLVETQFIFAILLFSATINRYKAVSVNATGDNT